MENPPVGSGSVPWKDNAYAWIGSSLVTIIRHKIKYIGEGPQLLVEVDRGRGGLESDQWLG